VEIGAPVCGSSVFCKKGTIEASGATHPIDRANKSNKDGKDVGHEKHLPCDF
jgi:hypothetical protein